MNISAIASEVASGRVLLRRRIAKLGEFSNRSAFIAALLGSGIAQSLADEVMALEDIAAAFHCPATQLEALRAWLDLGVELKVLRRSGSAYRLRSSIVTPLLDPQNDSLFAMAQCIPIEQQFVLEAIDKIRDGRKAAQDSRYSELVARLSRQLEPLAVPMLENLVPRCGAFNVLDVGCGGAGYLKHVASLNPLLCGVGVERIPSVVEHAVRNLRDWNLSERIRIVGDVESIDSGEKFDLALLNLVIHYTPLTERLALLTRIRRLLQKDGRVFIANPVRRCGSGLAFLNLWSVLSAGCGPIPDSREIEKLLREAGFTAIRREPLTPDSSFLAFCARTLN